MTKNLSKSVVSFLVFSGVLGGALVAIAVAPLQTYPPTTNDTVVNFDSLLVGAPMDDSADGFFQIFQSGQTFLSNGFSTNSSPFTTDGDGNLLPLRFGAHIDSENAGLYSLGHYIGLMGKALQADSLFGRVGVEGRVTGPGGTARGFAGYLEYDPSLSPTVENGINIGTLTANPGNNLYDDYIRISKGIPWAFYTENQSKFKGNVTIAGQLTAENEPLTFADLSGPVSDPVVEINHSSTGGGDLIADTIYADDFIATSNLSGQFFVATGSKSFNSNSDLDVFPAYAFCSSINPNSIRLGCGGDLNDDSSSAASSNTPYLGTMQYSNSGCKSYARKPPGASGYLRSYAYCWNPK